MKKEDMKKEKKFKVRGQIKILLKNKLALDLLYFYGYSNFQKRKLRFNQYDKILILASTNSPSTVKSFCWDSKISSCFFSYQQAHFFYSHQLQFEQTQSLTSKAFS